MVWNKMQRLGMGSVGAALAAGIALGAARTTQAQCYEFISGTAADLKINLASLPTPTVSATTDPSASIYTYTYSQEYGAGNSASLQVGPTLFNSVAPLPDYLVYLVSSTIFGPHPMASSAFVATVILSDLNSSTFMGATVALNSHAGAFFNNGLGPSLRPILVWDGEADLQLFNPDGTMAQTLPITAIANCNPSLVSLAPATNIPTGTLAGGISPMAAAADFNGDGMMDLVTANLVDSTVSVLLGKGNGSFKAPVGYKVGHGPYGIVAGDFNGDGKPDIAVVNGLDNTISVLLNNKSGGFPSSPNYTYTVGSEPFGLSVADLNKDGFQDLIVTNTASGNFGVLLGKGDGSFQPQVTYVTGTDPFGTAIADVNGDGYPDVVAWNVGSNAIGVYLNDQTGNFAAPVSYATGGSPFSVSAGDFNGDGYPDLAVANLGSNTLNVLLNDKTGKFLPAVSYPTAALPASVLAVDLNGDGELDLAVANLGNNTVGVLLGKGDGTFLPQTTYLAEDQPYSLLAADFNGDGKPDLAVTSFFANTISILLQTTASTSKITTVPKRISPPVKLVPVR